VSEGKYERTKMSACDGLNWLKRVAIATAILTTVGLLAQPGKAFAAETAANAGSAGYTALLFVFVLLLASVRPRKIGGRWHVSFEPSPVRCVRAVSKVRRTGMRK
jgi:hypothetical protein